MAKIQQNNSSNLPETKTKAQLRTSNCLDPVSPPTKQRVTLRRELDSVSVISRGNEILIVTIKHYSCHFSSETVTAEMRAKIKRTI